jgi:glycosyltransferase involved in cell wall biosynthesis
MPLVSAIVPTRNRADLVATAVRSALAQTMTDLEVVVVVDGPDAATEQVLTAFDDPRLRVVVLPEPRGASAARNAGVDAARGAWVAFLDDDDEWLACRLERQLAVAEPGQRMLITSLARVETPSGTYIWPTELPDPAGRIDAYLFERRSWFLGAAFLQTSTWLLPRSLFQEVRFRPEGDPHDDWDFVIRLCNRHGARIVTVPEPLVAFRYEQPRPGLGRAGAWRDSLAWIDRMGELVRPSADASFCLAVAGASAAAAGAWRAVPVVLGRAFRRGRPTARQLALFASYWLVPQRLRRRIRAALSGATIRTVSPAL